MVEEGQDWKDVAIPTTMSTVGAVEESSTPPTPSSSAAPAPTTQYTHPAQTGPATALLLSQYGLNPANIEGSGPKGNLMKSDVLSYIKINSLPTPAPIQVPLPSVAKTVSTPASSPQASSTPVRQARAGYTDIELTSMRKVIAKTVSTPASS